LFARNFFPGRRWTKVHPWEGYWKFWVNGNRTGQLLMCGHRMDFSSTNSMKKRCYAFWVLKSAQVMEGSPRFLFLGRRWGRSTCGILIQMIAKRGTEQTFPWKGIVRVWFDEQHAQVLAAFFRTAGCAGHANPLALFSFSYEVLMRRLLIGSRWKGLS
jgi:hypothetical protein